MIVIQHNSAEAEPVTIGGAPLHQLLTNSMPELVEAVLDGLVEQLPDYRHLPSEQISGDIRRIIERNMRAVAEAVRTGTAISPATLAELREAVAQRAEEGVPIDAVISAHHLGLQVVWEKLSAYVGPDDVRSLIAFNRMQLAYLRDVTATVATGYFQERHAMFGDRYLARQSLLSAMLDGSEIQQTAQRAGISLPHAYFVLAIELGSHPDETHAAVDATVAGRRKLRRMRSEMERRVREPVLSALSTTGGTALVPCAQLEADAEDWDRLLRLVKSAEHQADTGITAGVVIASPEEVCEAVPTARGILDAAMSSGRSPGTYRMADVALEYQLAQAGPARDELAMLLLPLEEKPELMTTLRAYLRSGLSRRHTAKRLHLHPNTVDYRLRKIASLTGLDTTEAAHLPRIHAALTAYGARGALML